MFCPTPTMFSTVMKSVLKRLGEHHREDRWVDYFQRMYLDTRGESIKAVWWCGFASTFRPGCPPSQQLPEQFNKKVKRDIASLSLRTYQEVHTALEKLVDVWSAPMKPGEETLSGPKFVLSAPVSCASIERPVAPDAWMQQPGSAVLKQPGGYQYEGSVPTTKKLKTVTVECSSSWLRRSRRCCLPTLARSSVRTCRRRRSKKSFVFWPPTVYWSALRTPMQSGDSN